MSGALLHRDSRPEKKVTFPHMRARIPIQKAARRLHAESSAFTQAALRSEVTRANAVIAIIVALLVFIFLYESRAMDYRLVATAIGGLLVLLSVQVVMRLSVRWALKRHATLPMWFLATSVIVESLVPSVMIAAHLYSGALPPYASLVSPSIFAYGIVIALSTLRLRPWLCVLSGAVVAAMQLVMLAYVTSVLGIVEPTTGLPRVAYFTAPLLIFISGLAAAWVARELRKHVDAALAEVETRREVERLERDLDVARSIQLALMPRDTPKIDGFEVAAWNRPADQTGGDYYDWQRFDDGTWIVSVADVSGHGIGPALVTAACRAYVRASATHHRDLPALATHVNRLLADDLPDGRFVTMVCALLGGPASSSDNHSAGSEARPVTLLSAGHGPIALYQRAADRVEEIQPRDLPLAVLADASFGPSHTLSMHPGDVLVLITDGFVEWGRREPDGTIGRFGIERLRESLRRHSALPARDIIAAITNDVEAFAQGTPQQDDLTIVVIVRNHSEKTA